MPIGISFYTFQEISYLVDVYRKPDLAQKNLLNLGLYITFFPQLIAGPIVRYHDINEQISARTVTVTQFSDGLERFIIGLSKKVLLANSFAIVCDTIYGADFFSYGTYIAWIAAFSYAMQIYYDFSGYSDMAIGIGKIMGFDLPENFNYPYVAKSISDFWKRWHMTLTRFLTRYIYIPLGGNRKGKIRTYINIMIVFLVSGIWHGANWTFILWGLLHGILQVLNRQFKNLWDRVPKAIAWICTFMTVNILWILFYASSVSEFGLVLGKIFAFDGISITPMIEQLFIMNEIQMLLNMLGPIGAFTTLHMGIYMWTYIIIAFVIILIPKNLHEKEFRPTTMKAVISALLMIWAVISFKGVSTFLYFNF